MGGVDSILGGKGDTRTNVVFMVSRSCVYVNRMLYLDGTERPPLGFHVLGVFNADRVTRY